MSSPVAGKFQDHYLILGVEPKSDSEAIQAAYTKLARKYHPNTPETGDEAKFEAVNLAYEILSDPSLRIEFDKVKGVDHEAGDPKFTGVDFFHGLEQGTVLRSAVLCILYDRRRVKSFKPSLSMRHLENMLHVTAQELNFALWYLKQRGYVLPDDKSSMEITVEGMDYLEHNRPSPEAVMPMIKPDALAGRHPQTDKPPVVEAKLIETKPAENKPVEAKATEPVLSILNRALQRNQVSEEPQPVTKR